MTTLAALYERRLDPQNQRKDVTSRAIAARLRVLQSYVKHPDAVTDRKILRQLSQDADTLALRGGKYAYFYGATHDAPVIPYARLAQHLRHRLAGV